MVLGKLPVPVRPTNLDHSRARAYCACSGCGWGLFGIFSLVYPFSFLSPSLWETARYRLKYCLKGPLRPKQPTNQPYFFGYKTDAFSFLNNPADLDQSCKTDLDLLDCLGRVKLVLYQNFKGMIYYL